MKVIRAASELGAAGRKVCLAIGVFDGVHLGHQQIIRQTIADTRQRDGAVLAGVGDGLPDDLLVAQMHAVENSNG